MTAIPLEAPKLAASATSSTFQHRCDGWHPAGMQHATWPTNSVASLRSATGDGLKSLRLEQQGRRRRDEPGRFQSLIPQLSRNSNVTNHLSRTCGCWCAILRCLIPSHSRCFQSLKKPILKIAKIAKPKRLYGSETRTRCGSVRGRITCA